jgi:hypothetical protein
LFNEKYKFAIPIARVAELVDALDSKSSSGNRVRVRFPPRVQKQFGVLSKSNRALAKLQTVFPSRLLLKLKLNKAKTELKQS